MKKVLLSAVALLAFGFANAQEEKSTEGGFSKGSMFVSGSVGFNSAKEGDVKSNEFGFKPAFGYFLSDNIAVGARLDFVSGEDESKNKTNDFGTELYGRYYFTPASKFSVFSELAIAFGSEKYEPNVGAETKHKYLDFNAALGVNYFISKNFAFEAAWAGLGYNSRKLDASGADARNTFDIGFDLSNINLGLVYKF